MRRIELAAFAFALISGLSCNLFRDDRTTDPTDGDETTDEQVSDAVPDGPRCHSGTFEWADGPDVTACGTWYFDVGADDTLVGGGEITAGLPNVPVTVTLTGTVDPTSDTIELTLTSADDGSGVMRLTYTGTELELVGSWSFTHAPEPEGIEIGGQAAGVSCEALP